MTHLFFWGLGYLAVVIMHLLHLPNELTLVSLSGMSVWLLAGIVQQNLRTRLLSCALVSSVVVATLAKLSLFNSVSLSLLLISVVQVLLLSEIVARFLYFGITTKELSYTLWKVFGYIFLPSLLFCAIGCFILVQSMPYSLSAVFSKYLVGNILGMILGMPFILACLTRGTAAYSESLYKPLEMACCGLAVLFLALAIQDSWVVFVSTLIAIFFLSALLKGFQLLSTFGLIVGGLAAIMVTAVSSIHESNLPVYPEVSLFIVTVVSFLSAMYIWRYKKIAQSSHSQLSSLHESYRHTFELSPSMLVTLNSAASIIEVSDGFVAALNRSRKELIGSLFTDFVLDDVKRRELLAQLSTSDKFSLCHVRLGASQDIIVNLKAQVFKSGDGPRALCYMQDISELTKLSRDLEQDKELLEVTLSSIGDGVICTDVNSNVTYMNPVAEAILARLTSEVKGLPFDEVMPLYNEDTKEPIKGLTDYSIKNNMLMGLPELTCVKNHLNLEFAIQDSISPIYLKNGEIAGAVMVFQDVTESRMMSRKMSHLAHHDVLTGLPNRLLLQDRLSQSCKRACREGHKFALVFIDLDKFKKINDSLGHDVGDQLLKQVAVRLSQSVRECDTVSRMGGDEFVVILDTIRNKKHVGMVAKKLIDAVSGSYELTTVQIDLSVSAGIAIYPVDGVTAEELMKHADTAMYRAKKVVKSDYQFYSMKLDQEAEQKVARENEIANAIKNDEFIPYYQPVVNAHSYLLEKLEMLARWQTNSELRSPESFISIAEDANLIDKVSEQLFAKAFQDFSQWITKKPDLTLSINVSVTQLGEPQFIDSLLASLESYKIPPHNIEIEITESSLVSNLKLMKKTLQEIQKTGIRVAIDDFGTGYSSLSYLKHLSFDTIKVDQKFVSDLNNEDSSGALAVVIVQMAKSLRVNCVAEGVETAQQAHILSSSGCSQLQGYYFSKPKSATDIDSIIEAGISIDKSHSL